MQLASIPPIRGLPPRAMHGSSASDLLPARAPPECHQEYGDCTPRNLFWQALVCASRPSLTCQHIDDMHSPDPRTGAPKPTRHIHQAPGFTNHNPDSPGGNDISAFYLTK